MSTRGVLSRRLVCLLIFSISSVPWEKSMFVVKFLVIQDPPIFIVKSEVGLV